MPTPVEPGAALDGSFATGDLHFIEEGWDVPVTGVENPDRAIGGMEGTGGFVEREASARQTVEHSSATLGARSRARVISGEVFGHSRARPFV